ncbi:MAG: alkaline phosphatase family protein [Planctomycetes bacterium]|nr:alkaline phosphatase family protein [Planctomycetota bacterium]
MRLPRWTTYPALAMILGMIVIAVPTRRDAGLDRTVTAPDHPRVVVIGIDGMDPEILQETIQLFPDRMRNFAKLAAEQGIHSLGTSNPPQSPVAWSNFITGRNPGGHGIYDFIHRDLTTRMALPSTTKSTEAHELSLWSDWQLPLFGGDTLSNRTGDTFWGLLAKAGIPADVWRIPANFPVEESLGLSFSGMMTPALDSAYGKFTFYTTNPPTDSRISEHKIQSVTVRNGVISNARVDGPPNAFKELDEKTHEPPAVTVPLKIFVDEANDAAAVELDGRVVVLRPGEWSEFVPATFSSLPMSLADVTGIVRFYLRSVTPEFEMYASPVNIDPSAPAAPVSEPADASAELAAPAPEGIGPYYTQGMAEDVGALKAEVLTPPEFMDQAQLVHDESTRMLDYALDHYVEKQAGGLLFFYFSSVDLCCHMMWRHSDEQHPHHDKVFAAQDSSKWSQRPGSTWKDTVHDLYMRMDPVIGRIHERLDSDTTLILMSDHGFAPYRRKFSLNTWLLENGYLVLKDGAAKELPETDPAHREVYLNSVDWSKTRAYGMGFQGLYLNLAGRELDDPHTPENETGIVQSGAEADALLAELKTKLEAIVDPKDGGRVVLRCDLAKSIYTGERVADAPDIVVGYNADYGNSDEASVGRIPDQVLSDNLGGTFNGSHLMAPEVVQGILMSNRPVRPGAHGLEDLTVDLLERYGVKPGPGMNGHPVIQ